MRILSTGALLLALSVLLTGCALFTNPSEVEPVPAQIEQLPLDERIDTLPEIVQEVPIEEPEVSLPPTTPAQPLPVTTSTLYKSSWFNINYPSDFTVIEKEKSNALGYFDGVAFTAPDDTVTFYIYSPQWSGISDYETLQENESVTATETQTKGDTTITWTTITNSKTGAARSYQVTEKYGTVRYLIGISYQDQASYTTYKDQYLAFKNSLVQFAD